MKFAMCNEFCEGWPLERVCRLAADAGYGGVEVAPFTLAPTVDRITWQQRQDAAETAARAGVEIVGLHWLLVGPKDLHLNSRDPNVRRRTLDYLKAEVDLCADLGGSVMVLGSPKQRNIPPGQSYAEVWDRTVEAMRELGAGAEEKGVCICIEPLGASETNFIHTAEQARRLVCDVARPGFRMMLDVKAMAEDERPAPEIIRECGPYLKHFHANDVNRQGPGAGDTEFRPIAEALYEVGYDGYVSVEVFDYSAGPEKIALRSIEYLKRAFR